MRRRTTRTGFAAALFVGVMLGASPAVVAHSSLIGSTPEDGAVVAEAPEEVVLEFDEDLQPDFSQVAVLDAAENHYEHEDPVTDGPTVTQAVTELPAGDYSISYRVGSADGHPVTGVISFTVEPPENGDAGDEAASDEQTADEAAGAQPTEPSASRNGSEEGTSTETVAATIAAVTVVGIAAVLLLRRGAGTGNDDSAPDGQ